MASQNNTIPSVDKCRFCNADEKPLHAAYMCDTSWMLVRPDSEDVPTRSYRRSALCEERESKRLIQEKLSEYLSFNSTDENPKRIALRSVLKELLSDYTPRQRT